jgi:hypothetical protein
MKAFTKRDVGTAVHFHAFDNQSYLAVIDRVQHGIVTVRYHVRAIAESITAPLTHGQAKARLTRQADDLPIVEI